VQRYLKQSVGKKKMQLARYSKGEDHRTEKTQKKSLNNSVLGGGLGGRDTKDGIGKQGDKVLVSITDYYRVQDWGGELRWVDTEAFGKEALKWG